MNTIVIIEDHPVMREGLASWFANSGRWKVAGTAATLAEAKKLLSENKSPIDLILLDIQLPDGWGLDCLREVRSTSRQIPYQNKSRQGLDCIHQLKNPRPIIAVYSSFNDYSHVSAALGMGVKAYITKQRNNQELEAALLQALNGEICIDDTAQTRFEKNSDLIKLLTKREREILSLIKDGLSNKQIASRLEINQRTVENSISLIYEKIGIKSRMELVKL